MRLGLLRDDGVSRQPRRTQSKRFSTRTGTCARIPAISWDGVVSFSQGRQRQSGVVQCRTSTGRSDFPTEAAAQACYLYCIHLGYGDIHRLGGDNDGKFWGALPQGPQAASDWRLIRRDVRRSWVDINWVKSWEMKSHFTSHWQLMMREW